ncbi:chromate efflux transporter [Leucobacter sp. CSA1]|uniref:Chromate efflux transporter n=1 Tax=Leucobacter chromiisoli TaxID=2796471 RepID=A0A934Q5W3_9MICO|nr:chromate efflux transporter [Leucobacter chromiisoli]MBK0417958.1 chromate efflux transporter [Leucobacter chromiisoli]
MRPASAPPRGSALEVLRVFLALGVTSFGGPVAHLGYFREELVARRRWVSEPQYAELVALCQFLPGPASSQVGFALGLIRAGGLGALAAWAAFTLPSALLMVLFAIGAVSLDGPVGQGVLAGLKCVAVAVVAHAVWGMARTLTPDLRRLVIAAVAAALALLLPGNLGQIAAILLGLAAGALLCRRAVPEVAEPLDVRVSRRVALAALALFGLLLGALPILARAGHEIWAGIADAFFRAGALVFGGGHVVLPLLQAEPMIADAVGREQFLAGYGAAQAVPGPLFTFAAYLGFEMGPGGAAPMTALLSLVAVFLPGILLLLGALPFWNRLRASAAVRSAMAGANAAVVGILGAALWTPVITSGITGPASLLIASGCLALLVVWRLPAWIAVAAGAACGAAAGLLVPGWI